MRGRSSTAQPDATAGALDRIGRRGSVEAPVDRTPADRTGRVAAAAATLADAVAPRLKALVDNGTPAGEVTRQAGLQIQVHFRNHGVILAPLELRGYVGDVLRPILPATNFNAPAEQEEAPDDESALPGAPGAPTPSVPRPSVPRELLPSVFASPAADKGGEPSSRPESTEKSGGRLSRSKVDQARRAIQPLIMNRIDLAAAVSLPRKELTRQFEDLVAELLVEHRLQLNRPEQADLIYQIVNDMLGLGPLEPLLEDEAITDIMINGPKQVYIERRGKIEMTSVTFENNAHLLNICNRIVSRIGRRVDEASPICDARLQDGSRVNIIIPPLAIDGPSVSIRKFGKRQIGFDQMVQQGNISAAMATLLRVAARCRLNIVVSGGTGSGKTTMLNALSGMIDDGERVVTIEDAAELRMQQPHVVRLETRPANLEGNGEVNMRDLVKNALRMRPDRIILGEVRGPEAIDLLQAMNTGHDGSMGTLHANRPREALTRLENMVTMGVSSLPPKAIRTQIAGSLQLIVQISRMRDGVRRVTHITEVAGVEGDVIITQDLFTYEFKGEGADGRLIGAFKSSGLRPHFLPRAAYYGLDKVVMEAIS
ncbi:MAG: Flp pilus assembly complex ATPase component TadA [Proteobacteria bacterium]|nr:Flp pilus assembly complex ATPase component TadA [Pseudomonadota bacterium]